MDRVPAFLSSFLKVKRMKDSTQEELNMLYPNDIPLNLYTCVCRGYIRGERVFDYLQILKCAKTPLLGQHHVLYNDEVHQIESLTIFKNTVLGHEDRNTFEKSAFLIDFECEKVIKMSLIRTRIQLPLIVPLNRKSYVSEGNALLLQMFKTLFKEMYKQFRANDLKYGASSLVELQKISEEIMNVELFMDELTSHVKALSDEDVFDMAIDNLIANDLHSSLNNHNY